MVYYSILFSMKLIKNYCKFNDANFITNSKKAARVMQPYKLTNESECGDIVTWYKLLFVEQLCVHNERELDRVLRIPIRYISCAALRSSDVLTVAVGGGGGRFSL